MGWCCCHFPFFATTFHHQDTKKIFIVLSVFYLPALARTGSLRHTRYEIERDFQFTVCVLFYFLFLSSLLPSYDSPVKPQIWHAMWCTWLLVCHRIRHPPAFLFLICISICALFSLCLFESTPPSPLSLLLLVIEFAHLSCNHSLQPQEREEKHSSPRKQSPNKKTLLNDGVTSRCALVRRSLPLVFSSPIFSLL